MSNRHGPWGLRFFWLYAAAYLGFVMWNALAPATMERSVAGGVSLAILSGLGIIALAVVLALLYGLLCREEARPAADRGAAADRGERLEEPGNS